MKIQITGGGGGTTNTSVNHNPHFWMPMCQINPVATTWAVTHYSSTTTNAGGKPAGGKDLADVDKRNAWPTPLDKGEGGGGVNRWGRITNREKQGRRCCSRLAGRPRRWARSACSWGWGRREKFPRITSIVWSKLRNCGQFPSGL